MSNSVYDVLKWIGLIAVPVITFLTALINIWNIPYGDQIIATLAAIDVLIGAIVAIAKVQYEKKRKVVVTDVASSIEAIGSEDDEKIDTVEEQNQEE
jgi:hypothetical protein